MIEKTEAELEQTQVATVGTVDDFIPTLPDSQATEANDPMISDTGRYQQSGHTVGMKGMAFLNMESPTLPVGEKGFNGEALGVPLEVFFGGIHA